MRTLERSIRLAAQPEAAWQACLALLHTPDAGRGITARRCDPDPPRAGGRLVTTVVADGGTRDLVSRIDELEPPRVLTTTSEQEGPAVRTRLEVAPDGDGSRVTLRSEATTALTGRGWLLGLLDSALLARSQRRSARATLSAVRRNAAPDKV